jgi:hypothetical protein
VTDYLARYSRILDPLIQAGYVLPTDRAGILSYVQNLYDSAPTGM